MRKDIPSNYVTANLSAFVVPWRFRFRRENKNETLNLYSNGSNRSEYSENDSNVYKGEPYPENQLSTALLLGMFKSNCESWMWFAVSRWSAVESIYRLLT